MKIASAASAFPKHYYPQKFLLEKLQEYWGDRLKNPQMLARLHRNVAVEGRHLAISPEKYNDITTWGQANDVWIEVAQELGEQSLCRALHHAGLEPKMRERHQERFLREEGVVIAATTTTAVMNFFIVVYPFVTVYAACFETLNKFAS